MWPKKSSPAIKRKNNNKRTPEGPFRNKCRKMAQEFWSLLLLLPLLSAGCGPASTTPETAPPLRVRIAPLHDYAWIDRTGSGQPVDMKPQAARVALLRELTTPPLADLLILRGLGSEAALHHLRDALAARDAEYRALYFHGPTPYRGLGVLHRGQNVTPDPDIAPTPYRIGDREHLPMFGSVSVAISEHRKPLFVNARLPSPDAPYERRRNEARLLTRALRDPVKNGREVLLSLHSREDPDSPMMRMFTDIGLERLQPADSRGDHWTHRGPRGVRYLQDQWLFASPALAGRLASHGRVLDTPDLRAAGPYRHQLLELP